ncbi:MAG: hypothetical protein U9R00_02455 [Patescibacteria group bacterium]|nr:hypothetical protein [Patescibacteria group bacterium]
MKYLTDKLGGRFFDDPKVMLNFYEKIKNDEFDHRIFSVSAIGCSTNNLLHIFNFLVDKKLDVPLKKEVIFTLLNYFNQTHQDLMDNLFDGRQRKRVKKDIGDIMNNLNKIVYYNERVGNEDVLYASILQYGEILSSKILHHFLNFLGCENNLLDARKYVLMDKIRDGNIILIKPSFVDAIRDKKITIISGFIGKSGTNSSIGKFNSSDDSLAFFSTTLFGDLKDVIIATFWKDFPGVGVENPSEIEEEYVEFLPKITANSYLKLIETIGSYPVKPEAIICFKEKIHPKSRSKVFVKSYKEPEKIGTEIVFNGKS